VPTLDIIVNSAGVMGLPERTLTEDGIEMHFATNHIGHFLFANLLMPKLIRAAEQNPIKGATRIVNVSSMSPTLARIRWSDINFDKKNKDLPEEQRPNYKIQQGWGEKGDLGERSYLPLEGYNQSKVANVLFSIGMNNRVYEKYSILSLALHPGVIKTELGRSFKPEMLEAVAGFNVTYRTTGAGASTSLVAALDPKLRAGESKDGGENYGVFLRDCQIMQLSNPGAVSNEEAERLWEVSEELVKEKFTW
jgi:NAD(P)-dependent dehydrogenase (short-subunit alcohol dehydrogenase family)